jgi:pyruvate formate lyase activating enzyme
VTGRNDSLEESDKVARWMLDNLDENVPLHYVRFHPDFKYTHVERTSIPFLEEARRSAMAMGMKYVYVGNVYDTQSVNTSCPHCGEVIVERYGLNAKVNLRGSDCPRCGSAMPIVAWAPPANAHALPDAATEVVCHDFRGAVQAIHVEQDHESTVHYQFVDASGSPIGERATSTCTRFMIAKAYPEATGVRMMHAPGLVPRLYEVYDRAHFPTVNLATAIAASDATPLPAHVKP